MRASALPLQSGFTTTDLPANPAAAAGLQEHSEAPPATTRNRPSVTTICKFATYANRPLWYVLRYRPQHSLVRPPCWHINPRHSLGHQQITNHRPTKVLGDSNGEEGGEDGRPQNRAAG